VEVLARRDQAFRNDAVPQDFLVSVDVGEKHLESLDALLDAAFETRPLPCCDDAGHLIERERAFLAGQRERDALVDERASERIRSGVQVHGVRRGERRVDSFVRRSSTTVRVEHLVEGEAVLSDVGVPPEHPVCIGFDTIR
jgi:hypothetical protein